LQNLSRAELSLAALNTDSAAGRTTGVADIDDPEFALVLAGLKQAGIAESLILGTLVENLQPDTVDTPAKLKALLHFPALATFSAAPKETAAQQKLAAAAGKNEVPVFLAPGQTIAAPAADGSIRITLATASDKETEKLGQHLRYVIVNAPSKGSLSELPADGLTGGSITYSPATSDGGALEDSFSWRICDAVTPPACTDAVVVTVSTPAANAAPNISDASDKSIYEDVVLSGIAVTIGDADGALVCKTALTGASSNSAVLLNTGIIVSGSYPTCLISLTPVANASGSATITPTVSDGNLSATDTFDLAVAPVNDAPTQAVAGDTSVITAEETPVSVALHFDSMRAQTTKGSIHYLFASRSAFRAEQVRPLKRISALQ
jgi:hypothetical protein